MARGSKTGGRGKGTPNRATAAKAAEIAASGLTPLDYMLNVLRDENIEWRRRDEMAKAAAPYVHPKLATVEQRSEQEHPFLTYLENMNAKAKAEREAAKAQGEGTGSGNREHQQGDTP